MAITVQYWATHWWWSQAGPALSAKDIYLGGSQFKSKNFHLAVFVQGKWDFFFWARQEFIRNLREERKDVWVCCWTSVFRLRQKFAEVAGLCIAPSGERCRNPASQYQSFGFTHATAASPGRSGPPWGHLEEWSSHEGKSMSSCVIFLNVQPGADTLWL